MACIKDPLELGRQSYALATGTLNPEAKRALQDIAKQYLQSADMIRRSELIQSLSPSFGRRNSASKNVSEKI